MTSVASKRQTVYNGLTFFLDGFTSAPVLLRVIAVNGNGWPVSDENDRGVVLRLNVSNFDAVFGGDISATMESRIAGGLRPVEWHKVHDHGSASSSSVSFLQMDSATSRSSVRGQPERLRPPDRDGPRKPPRCRGVDVLDHAWRWGVTTARHGFRRQWRCRCAFYAERHLVYRRGRQYR